MKQSDIYGIVSGVRVRLDGLNRISKQRVLNEVSGLGEVRTVSDLVNEVSTIKDNFDATNVFQSTDVSVSPSQSEADSFDVVFNVKEKRPFVTVGTEINRSGQPSAELQFNIPGVCGTFHTASASATFSPRRTSSAVTARYVVPRLAASPNFRGLLRRVFGGGTSVPTAAEASPSRRQKWDATLQLQHSETDWTRASSFKDTTSEASLSFHRHSTVGRLQSHGISQRISIVAALRDMCPISVGKRVASPFVAAFPTNAFKTSIGYQFTIDSLRSNPTPDSSGPSSSRHPTAGRLLSSSLELAGIPGTVNFLKCQVLAISSLSLPQMPLTLQTKLYGGILAPLTTAPIPIQEKLFLGGSGGAASSLPGFADRSVGPAHEASGTSAQHEGGSPAVDYTGGDCAISACLALSAPLPVPKAASDSNLEPRVVGFVNAGSIVDNLNVAELFPKGRVSAGVGVGVPLGMGDFELTYTIPLLAQTTDSTERFQLGLRLRRGFC